MFSELRWEDHLHFTLFHPKSKLVLIHGFCLTLASNPFQPTSIWVCASSAIKGILPFHPFSKHSPSPHTCSLQTCLVYHSYNQFCSLFFFFFFFSNHLCPSSFAFLLSLSLLFFCFLSDQRIKKTLLPSHLININSLNSLSSFLSLS